MIAAAMLFACAGCGRSPEDWRAGLEGEDPFERGLSALALARVAPAEATDTIPHLLELVEGRDASLAAAARGELARLARPHVKLLIEILTETEGMTPKFRSALCDALTAAGSDAVGPLRAHLLDGGATSPRELGQILADIGPSSVAPLVADLADPNPRRRLCTAWILGRLGSQAGSAVPVLTGMVERDELFVARQAALALVEIAPLDEATRLTLERTSLQRSELARPLREALARLCLNRVRAGADKDSGRRLFALGDEAFVPVVEACSADDPGLQAVARRQVQLRYAALALGFPRGLPEVERDAGTLRAGLVRRDAGPRARSTLQIAMLGARGVEFLPLLEAHAEDSDAGVACCARLALLHVVRCLAFEGARKTP